MNKSLFAVVVALFAVVTSLRPAFGGTLDFSANITNDQEVATPPVPAQGSSGTGTFVYTFVGDNPATGAAVSLTYNVTLVGLDLDGNQTPGNANDNAARTHIHNAPAGSNGGIVFGQIDASANLRNDINPNDLVVNAAAGTISGKWDAAEGANNVPTLEAQKANLLAGNLYFNVHTSDHPGGEIRGQILLVPEPASLALLLLGAAPLWMRRRRA